MDEYHPSGNSSRWARWADNVFLRMNTNMSPDQFKFSGELQWFIVYKQLNQSDQLLHLHYYTNQISILLLRILISLRDSYFPGRHATATQKTNNLIENSMFKNPNQLEAGQLAIFKHGRGFELGMTKKKPSQWQGGGLKPNTTALQYQCPRQFGHTAS